MKQLRYATDELLGVYGNDLIDYLDKSHDPDGFDNRHSAHLALIMIEDMHPMHNPTKLNRCLGFVQGIMWHLLLRTKHELEQEWNRVMGELVQAENRRALRDLHITPQDSEAVVCGESRHE